MSKKAATTPDRLKRRSDFLRLRDTGRKWVAPTVIVQIGKGEGENVRVGLTATKKTGNAVMRNKIKRRLREAIKIVFADGIAPTDIVLIGRTETATCPFAALVKDLRWCLKRLEGSHDEKNPHPAA
jgi:ribonuclease P protein component